MLYFQSIFRLGITANQGSVIKASFKTGMGDLSTIFKNISEFSISDGWL